VRNQRLKAPQSNTTSSNLADLGWAAARTRPMRVGELLGPVDVAGREATMKVCGVVVAMRQGHSWAPPWTSGHAVNVGTVPAVPHPLVFGPVGGKARRRLMASGRGGGLVVVGGRESRPHGEGVQRDRSRRVFPGGRW
jgi:hypothetical protein